MNAYSSLARPLLFRLPPETAHRLTLASLRFPLVPRLLSGGVPAPEEPVELMGLKFRNRLGIAAGVDKNAEATLAWHELGFGFAELGTITLHAQPGNPKPRVFRFPNQQALIQGLPLSDLENLADALLDFQGPEDLKAWLNRHAS